MPACWLSALRCALLSGEVALQGAVLNPGLAGRGSSAHHGLVGLCGVQRNALNPRHFCVFEILFFRGLPCASLRFGQHCRQQLSFAPMFVQRLAVVPLQPSCCPCGVTGWVRLQQLPADCCILGPCRPLPLALPAVVHPAILWHCYRLWPCHKV